LIPRTNISLASWDLPNIGGDLIALCGNAFVCTTLLVLIETGSFMWLVRRCSKEQLKVESSDIESLKEFEEDVIIETKRVQGPEFKGLLKVVNLRKEFN